MSVAYGKGPKGKATRLHSLIVRSRGACELCGESDYTRLQAAHIISRRYTATRTDLLNAWCLCVRCHRRTEEHADEFMALVEVTIGLVEFYELKRRAEGLGRVGVAKFDWEAEADRLTALYAEIAAA